MILLTKFYTTQDETGFGLVNKLISTKNRYLSTKSGLHVDLDYL